MAPRRYRGSVTQPIVLGGLLAVVLSLIAFPLWTVLRLSFEGVRGEAGFSLQWYQAIFSPENVSVLWNTAVVVAGSSVLAITLGFLLAWLVERVDFPLRSVGRLIPIAPLLIPPVVGSAAWSFLLSPEVGYLNRAFRVATGSEAPLFDIYSLAGVVLVVTLYVVPYAFTVFYPALRSMNLSLEEAARVAGAGPIEALRTVTLGVLRPAITGALILVVVISLSQFAIPLIIGRGRIPVITTSIYRAMTSQPANPGLAGALSMVILTPSLALLWLNYRLLRGRSFATVTGKLRSGILIRSWSTRLLAVSLVGGYALGAVVLPLISLSLVAFRRFWDGALTVEGFTLRHLDYIWNDYPTTWIALRTSGGLGLVGGMVSVAIGFVIAYFALRRRRLLTRSLDFLSSLPLGVPTTVLGLGFLLAFSRSPFELYGTTSLLVLAYFVIFLPHAVRAIQGSMAQVSPELEEAARTSGSGWIGSISRITLPLVAPGVLGAWALLFILLSREVPASVFLATIRLRLLGPALLDMWTAGQYQAMAAFSLIVVVFSGGILYIMQAAAGFGPNRARRRRSLVGGKSQEAVSTREVHL